MFESLDRLRQKPDGAKRKIAFFTSFSVVLVIFVVWLTVIYPDFMNKNSGEVVEKKADAPVDNFASVFTESLNRLGEEIGKLKDLTSGLSSSTSSYYNATDTPKN